MYDLNRIIKEFNEACSKAGVLNTYPIRINGRLTRTLGRVRYTKLSDNTIEPLDIEFSKQFLETASDASIKDVILHEAAHLIVAKRTKVHHGHDAYFKKVCAELGTKRDGYAGEVELVKTVKYKYTIICPNCGEIGGYNRMCKTIKEINYCTCKKCGSRNLRVAS